MQKFNKREYISSENVYKQDFVYDQPEELSDFNEMPEFEKLGYIFKGWSTNQNSLTAEFINKEEISNLTPVDNATINLYAVWEKANYVIQYNPFISGDTFISSVTGNTYYQSALYDSSFNLIDNKFSDDSGTYRFVGWFDYKKLYTICKSIDSTTNTLTPEDAEFFLNDENFTLESNGNSITENRLAPYEFNGNVTNLFALFVKIEIFTYDIIETNIIDGTTFNNCKITGLTDYGKTLSSLLIKSHDSNIKYVEIGAGAFKDNNKLINITFDCENILTIGDNVLENCEKLKSVEFRNSTAITTISKSAFKNCKALKNITIPSSVTLIDEYAFANCNTLRNIIFPADSELSEIKNYAFAECNCLTKIDIPSSIENIGSVDVFKNCYELRYININGNDSLDSNIYSTLINNTYYCKVLSNNNEIALFNFDSNDNTKITSLTEYGKTCNIIYIPNNIENIGSSAFADNNNVKEVIISNKSKLQYIESSAFKKCKNLSAMYFPESLNGVNEDAFDGCDNLENIFYNVDSNSGISILDKFTNKNNINLAEIKSNTTFFESINGTSYIEITKLTYAGKTQSSITIPEKISNIEVKNISKYVFYNDINLESITLPNTLENINIGAFKECTALKTINLPNDAIDILQLAFYNTKSLSNIKINTDSQLTNISEYAFGNSGLESIVLPSTLIILNSYVFDNCKNLKNVRFLAPELDYIYDFAFNGCTQLENIYIYNIKDMSNYYKWVS